MASFEYNWSASTGQQLEMERERMRGGPCAAIVLLLEVCEAQVKREESIEI